MATLVPAGRSVKSSGGSSGSFEALQRASSGTPTRQVPTSPKSSSGRLERRDAILSGTQTNAAPEDSGEPFSVDELIRALPDNLFPFDDEDETDALTPFTAVYGVGSPSPANKNKEPSTGRPPRAHRDSASRVAAFQFGSGSCDSQLGSAPASRGHGFGGRETTGNGSFSTFGNGSSPNGNGSPFNYGGRDGAYGFGSSSPGSESGFHFGVSPPAYGGADFASPRTSQGSNHSTTTWSPGLALGSTYPNPRKYTPPNRVATTSVRDDARFKSKRDDHERRRNKPPVKKNPAPGFTGAGFRSARDLYVASVHTLLCNSAVFGSPWVLVNGNGDSVDARLTKPATIPETYETFFKRNPTQFELSPCQKFVAAKMPGEDHACIPPPPTTGDTPPSRDNGHSSPCASANPSLASSPDNLRDDDAADGFLAARRPLRQSKGSGFFEKAPSATPCAYFRKPGGCRAGDACRFSHA